MIIHEQMHARAFVGPAATTDDLLALTQLAPSDENGAFVRFADSSPDCIRLLNLGGHIEFINARGRILFEIDDIAGYLGRSWPSLWPEIVRPVMAAALKGAAAGETRSFRAFCPTAKGGGKWWDTAVWPIFGSDDGPPTHLVARSRDITEEIQTQSLLDAIVEFVPAGLFVKDAATGRFLLVNRGAETALGFPRGQLLGKTDHEIFPKAQADFFRETDLEVVRSGELTVVAEEQVTNGAGQVRWFRTKKIAIRGMEGAPHLLALAEDITDARAADDELRKALAQAEAANQAKSAFLATMSHEIRTPLNGLLGMAQAMQAGELSEEQRERLAIIGCSGETLLNILNDLLDLSKLEAGELELRCVDFDLERLVRESIGAFSQRAEQKGLSVLPDIKRSAVGTFNGDGARIRRVLCGLLSNAVKFTDAGQVEISVAHHDGELRIAVADTGPGIAPALLRTVFDNFVQGDDSLTRRFGGSGLGLSICRGLAELMGGHIEVDSMIGRGSVFTLRQPLSRASGKVPDNAGSAFGNGAPIFLNLPRPLHVLAAEDNAVNRLVLKTLLLQGGVEATFVENGQQAVEAWESRDWDVVLMDIQMPVMDGMNASRVIRARETQTGRARTPILAVTANAMTDQVASYRLIGMDGVVAKPLSATLLFAAIEGAVADGVSWPSADALRPVEAIIGMFRPN